MSFLSRGDIGWIGRQEEEQNLYCEHGVVPVYFPSTISAYRFPVTGHVPFAPGTCCPFWCQVHRRGRTCCARRCWRSKLHKGHSSSYGAMVSSKETMKWEHERTVEELVLKDVVLW